MRERSNRTAVLLEGSSSGRDEGRQEAVQRGDLGVLGKAARIEKSLHDEAVGERYGGPGELFRAGVRGEFAQLGRGFRVRTERGAQPGVPVRLLGGRPVVGERQVFRELTQIRSLAVCPAVSGRMSSGIGGRVRCSRLGCPAVRLSSRSRAWVIRAPFVGK